MQWGKGVCMTAWVEKTLYRERDLHLDMFYVPGGAGYQPISAWPLGMRTGLSLARDFHGRRNNSV